MSSGELGDRERVDAVDLGAGKVPFKTPDVNLLAPPEVNVMVSKIIMVQSLLNQLAQTKVRADFVNGGFGDEIRMEWLSELDQLRWTLFPRWLGLDSKVAPILYDRAATHMRLLLNKSESPLVLEGVGTKDHHTYYEWFMRLDIVAADKYWLTTAADARCSHVSNEDSLLKKNESQDNGGDTSCNSLSNRPKKKQQLIKSELSPSRSSPAKTVPSSDCKDCTKGSSHTKPASASDCSSRKKPASSASSSSRKKSAKYATQKIEEIVIVSTSDSSNIPSSDNSDADNAMPEPRHYRNRRRVRDHRDVVTPPVFVADGKVALKEFLSSFELYFKNKFNGSSYDQTQELSKFLKGDLLKVFNIKGGRKLKYQDMKDHLITWYKEQKIGGKAFWKKELGNVIPDHGESLDIYGMRLVEMVQLAYPDSKHESAKQLRKHFLDTIPSLIAEKIRNTERMLRAATNSKYMKFSKMTKMAREMQTETTKKSVMWTSTNAEQHQRSRAAPPVEATTMNGNNAPLPPMYSPTDRGQSVNREGQSNSNYRVYNNRSRSTDANRDLFCSYCKRRNHTAQDCWRASRSCLICGQNHFMNDCPSFDPNFRTRHDQGNSLNAGERKSFF